MTVLYVYIVVPVQLYRYVYGRTSKFSSYICTVLNLVEPE
jgi:hypothetical protein